MAAIHHSQSEPITQPSPTAINTPAQRWASSMLDRLIIEAERSNSSRSTLRRWKKSTLEKLFVPAFGREVRHD